MTGQRIVCDNPAEPASDTRGYLSAQFVFDEAWTGLNRLAVFSGTSGGSPASYTVELDENGACLFPAAALTAENRIFTVGAVGYAADGSRLTTAPCAIRQQESCFRPGATPMPPEPDLYADLYAAAAEAAAIARALQKAADSGEFDGPPGPRGDRGFSGLVPRVSRGAAASMTLSANTLTEISAPDRDITLSLAPGEEGYANEWAFTLTQGATARNVTLPSIYWGMGIAPAFLANTATLCRLYHIGSVLCGEWTCIDLAEVAAYAEDARDAGLLAGGDLAGGAA